MTAEEFLQNHLEISYFFDDITESVVCYSDEVQKAMIEFAKLHVEAALKAALEDAPYGSSTDTVSYKDMKDSILKAYPLDNIK